MIIVLSPFFSFMVTFKEQKAHNILSMMLDLCYKGLRLVIQYVRKDKRMQIIGEYVGMCCFHSWFISCKNLNPIAN